MSWTHPEKKAVSRQISDALVTQLPSSSQLAENLRELGMDVTIVQRPKQLMNPFDSDMASMIHSEI